MRRPGSIRSAAALLVLALTAPAEAAPPQTAPPAADTVELAPDGTPVVARGGDLTLSAAELEPVLLDRFAMAPTGRDVLKLLLQSAVIERMGAERGIEVTGDEIDALWAELDRDARTSGERQGLAAAIRERGLTPAEFRDFLRLSIVHERLTRDALDIPDGLPVSGDRQEIWLQQEMIERGLAWPAPPWKDGIAARSGDVTVDARTFGAALRERLDPEDVAETCWHLLLVKAIERRMPDLSTEAREKALDVEMARRRAKFMAQGDLKGVTFEEMLGAQGRTIEAMRRDPAVAVAALSRVWVDRTAGPEGLRAAYEENRAWFDGRFGKAVRTHFLFLTAGRFVNELNPRDYAMAERELERLADEIGNTDDFAAAAAQFSEDPTSRQAAGDLGYVTRLDARIPPEVPAAIFAFLDTGGTIPATGRALGPVRLDSGCGLVWISHVREAPAWEVMAEHVHEDLRRRFLEEIMPARSVEVLPGP